MAALILVVDDDPIQRRLLEAMTRRFGYEVETAENGEEGLARLEASDRPPVDLIVLDLVMPDLDGMGVLTRMRHRPDRARLDRGGDLGDARRRL